MSTTQESVRIGRKKDLERVYARLYLSTNQSNLADATWTKITLDSIQEDLGGNFVTASNKFVVPVTGLYHIIASIEFTSVVADKRYLTAIYNNGTSIREVSGQASLAANLTVECNDEVFLSADDEIELYGQAEAGASTVDVVSGLKATVLIIRLVTKEGRRQ